MSLVSLCLELAAEASAATNQNRAAPFVRAELKEYTIPQRASGPIDILAAPGHKNALFFTEYYTDAIGEISTAGKFAEYPLEASQAEPATGVSPQLIVPAGSHPYWLTIADNELWFSLDTPSTNFAGKLIGRNVTIYPASGACCIQNITTAPDGALWYPVSNYLGNLGLNTINRITTAGKLTFSAGLAYDSVPVVITPGQDGALWFTEEYANKIGRVTTKGRVTHLFSLPTAHAYPYVIAPGPDGALWFTEPGAGKIGRISTLGRIKEYALPLKTSEPFGIVAGLDGAVWFTEYSAGKIGRITSAGAIEEFKLPSAASEPYQITVGPDKALWFTEFESNKIGRIQIL